MVSFSNNSRETPCHCLHRTRREIPSKLQESVLLLLHVYPPSQPPFTHHSGSVDEKATPSGSSRRETLPTTTMSKGAAGLGGMALPMPAGACCPGAANHRFSSNTFSYLQTSYLAFKENYFLKRRKKNNNTLDECTLTLNELEKRNDGGLQYHYNQRQERDPVHHYRSYSWVGGRAAAEQSEKEIFL